MNRQYAPPDPLSAAGAPEGALALALALSGESVLIAAGAAPYPVLYVNATLCRRAGRPAAALLGQALSALAWPNDRRRDG